MLDDSVTLFQVQVISIGFSPWTLFNVIHLMQNRILFMQFDIMMNFLHFQAKALGKVLFEQVCRQLNLLEADYFGLEYSESTNANVKVIAIDFQPMTKKQFHFF